MWDHERRNTGPMAIFDLIFVSEDRKWKAFLDLWHLRPNMGRYRKWGGGFSKKKTSSKKISVFEERPIFEETTIFEKLSIFYSTSKIEELLHFRFSDPKIKEPSIFNLRSSVPRIEEPPIYDFRPRRKGRRSDGRE